MTNVIGKSDVKIRVYKEGNSNINISIESKEKYLFYQSLELWIFSVERLLIGL